MVFQSFLKIFYIWISNYIENQISEKKEISESCAQAKDRREYKKITKDIVQLLKWKDNDTVKSLIEELKQTYPRRPALLDELEKVEKKL